MCSMLHCLPSPARPRACRGLDPGGLSGGGRVHAGGLQRCPRQPVSSPSANALPPGLPAGRHAPPGSSNEYKPWPSGEEPGLDQTALPCHLPGYIHSCQGKTAADSRLLLGLACLAAQGAGSEPCGCVHHACQRRQRAAGGCARRGEAPRRCIASGQAL